MSGEVYTLGIGCRKGAMAADLLEVVRQVLAEAGIDPRDLATVGSIDGKSLEPAVLALVETLGLPLVTFSAERLEVETPRLANPSETVYRETGCHGVAEAAALAAAGESARLLVDKRVLGGCTAALAVTARVTA